MQKQTAGVFDRVISILTYITAGWGGMIVCVIMYFNKKHPSAYLRFNVFQSIFISLLYFILALGLGLICKFLSLIPFLNYLTAQIVFLLNRPAFLDYSIIQTFTVGLVIYLVACCAMGIYPRIYKISDIVSYAARK